MAWLDELNTTTKIEIVPGVVDQVFKNDPLLAYLRQNNIERFTGGTKIQENFTYAMQNGAHTPSATRLTSPRSRPTLAGSSIRSTTW